MRKLFFMIIAFLFVFSGSNVCLAQEDPEFQKLDPKDLYAHIELFSYALTTVESEYVEEKNAQDLIYGALQGMLALDAHSQFMTPEEYEELKEETEGKFGGLGIEISIRDGLLTVITPLEGTPAWDAGLQPNDRIVKIGDKVTKNMTLTDAVKMLRGEPGTDVTITILREEEFKIMDITITREIIHLQDVKYTQVLDDHIGYVRLTEFREDSGEAFHDALTTLKDLGANSLILDLRNNPGGLLNVALEITEEFIPEGQLILTTKGRRESQTIETYSGKTENKILDWPLVVLINGGSASGSEILAGAIKDTGRGVTLGTQSFGKGSVQSVIPMPDGSALRLTTSKYFTPSGISIHGTGIKPDIIVKHIYPSESEDEKEKKDNDRSIESLFEKIEEKDTDEVDTSTLTDEEKEVHERLMNDNQVISAMNVIKGIRVYKNASNKKTEINKALAALPQQQ